MENKSNEQWMRIALEEAYKAMKNGELPIGSVLVGGVTELSRGQTNTSRKGSMAAHGEILALIDAGTKIFSCDHPIVLYTTLEPCIMCLGAAINCGVEKIVYAMKAIPDGGIRYRKCITNEGVQVPDIVGGVLENEAMELMKKFVVENPLHFGCDYAKMLIY